MNGSNKDKVEMIFFLKAQALRNLSHAVCSFNESHTDRSTSVPYLSNLVQKCKNTFIVKDRISISKTTDINNY